MDPRQEFSRIVSENIKRDGISELMAWIGGTDFYTAPASTKYHGAHEGGLVVHSLNVYSQLKRLCNVFDCKASSESVAIVSLFHDLCKIEAYKFSEDEYGLNGEWQYNERQIIPGHGDKSIILLSQFMTLTEEEIFCIRFHMGPYEKWSRDQYGQEIEKDETVLWTHTADMYASKFKGI